MELLLSLLTGILYAAGIYMLLRRSMVKLIIGFALLSNAANLLIFTAGRPVRGEPPIVPPGGTELAAPYADPVPQALILTAIVIGFGVQVFSLVLLRRSYETVGNDDIDTLRDTDR